MNDHDERIDVRFDGTAWWIEDDSLERPLQFTRLADAETRACELSRDTGRGVCVHSWEGELIDTMPGPELVDVSGGYFDDASARFSLLELY